MNGESARCTRRSKLRAAFVFKLFFMSPICFLISCSSSSKQAVLLFGPLDDWVEWLGCLDDRSGQSGCLDDRSGRSGYLDDRAVLSVLWRLEGAKLPSLSALCLLGGQAFLRLVVSVVGYLLAVSFLVARPIFPLWRALALIVRSWWPLLDSVPQLLILTCCLPSEVLDTGRNDLYLSFDRGHGRISTGPVIGGSFHNRG